MKRDSWELRFEMHPTNLCTCDVRGLPLFYIREINFNELSEAGTVCVAHSRTVSERLEDGMHLEKQLLRCLKALRVETVLHVV